MAHQSENQQQLRQQPAIIADRVIVNGVVTPLTLTGDGLLRWTEKGQRCLSVEKEVLGFSMDGNTVRVRAFVEGGNGICCVGSTGDLVRKDFIFEPLSHDSRTLWSQKLREYIDSLGIFLLITNFWFQLTYFCLVDVQMWNGREIHGNFSVFVCANVKSGEYSIIMYARQHVNLKGVKLFCLFE